MIELLEKLADPAFMLAALGLIARGVALLMKTSNIINLAAETANKAAEAVDVMENKIYDHEIRLLKLEQNKGKRGRR